MVALSSTTSTLRPLKLSHDPIVALSPSPEYSETFSTRTVKRKVDPTPISLSTPISPPIIWTSCFAMLRPRPVPPNRLVVDASACEKESKILDLASGDIPMPVSRTSKRSGSQSPSSRAGAHSTAISPECVNFTALPMRLIRICLMRTMSPFTLRGVPGQDVAKDFDLLGLRSFREKADCLFDGFVDVEFFRVQLQPAGLYLREIEHVVDNVEQRDSGREGHIDVIPLLLGQGFRPSKARGGR